MNLQLFKRKVALFMSIVMLIVYFPANAVSVFGVESQEQNSDGNQIVQIKEVTATDTDGAYIQKDAWCNNNITISLEVTSTDGKAIDRVVKASEKLSEEEVLNLTGEALLFYYDEDNPNKNTKKYDYAVSVNESDARKEICYFWAINEDNKISESSSFEIKIDRKKPEVNKEKIQVSDTDGKVSDWYAENTKLVISGEVTDTDSGVQKVEYQYIQEDKNGDAETEDSSEFEIADLNEEKTKFSFTHTPEQSGCYHIKVTDNCGNISRQKVVVNIDGTEPKIDSMIYNTIISEDNNVFAGIFNPTNEVVTNVFKNCIGLTINVKETQSGVSKFYYSIDEFKTKKEIDVSKIKPNENGIYTILVEMTDSDAIKDKEVQLQVKAIDNCQNESKSATAEKAILASEDQITVEAVFKVGENDYQVGTDEQKAEWTNQDISVFLDTYYKNYRLDWKSNQYRYKYQINNDSQWDFLNGAATTITTPTGTVLKATYVYQNASLIQPENTQSPKYEIKIDKQKPQLGKPESTATDGTKITDWYNDSVIVSGTVTDGEGSGVEKVVYKYVESNAQGNILPPVYQEGSDGFVKADFNQNKFSFKIDEAERNGTYYIYAVDAVGNISDRQEIVIQLSQTLPEIKEVTASDAMNGNEVTSGNWSGENIELFVTAESKYAGINRVVFSEEKLEDIAEIKQLETKLELKNGQYYYLFDVQKEEMLDTKYYFWVIDNAGNVSESPDITNNSFEVKIDKISPVIESVVYLTKIEQDLSNNIFAGRLENRIENTVTQLVFKECIQIKVSAKDEGSGLNGFSYAVNGSDYKPITAVSEENQEDGTYIFLIKNDQIIEKDIELNITFKVQDNVGNYSEENSAENEIVFWASEENVKVAASFTLAESEDIYMDGKWTNRDIDVSLATVYQESNLYWLDNYGYRYQYKIDTEKWIYLDKNTDTISVPDGDVYNRTYTYQNSSLIHSENTQSDYVIQIDKQKPELGKPEATATDGTKIENWYHDSVIVSGSVTDNTGSGVNRVVYRYVEYQNGNADQPEYDAEFTGFSKADVDKNGTYSFVIEPEKHGIYYIYAIDNVDNVSDVQSIEILLDDTNPEVTEVSKIVKDNTGKEIEILNTDTVEWDGNGDTLTIQAKVTDNLSGFTEQSVVYRYVADEDKTDEEIIYDTENVTQATQITEGVYQFAIPNTTKDNQENNVKGTYYIWAIDKANNVSEKNSIYIQLDNINPEVTGVLKIVRDATGTEIEVSNTDAVEWDGNGDTLTIQAKVTDNLSGFTEKSVVYRYVADENKTAEEIIYDTEKVTQAQKIEEGIYQFTIPNIINNNQPNNVKGTYYIWAIDQAENVSAANSIDIKLDNTNPTNLQMKVTSKDGEDKFINVQDYNDQTKEEILFRYFYNKTITFALNATDEEKRASGMDSIQYQKVAQESEFKVDGEWTLYQGEITVDPNDRMIIYFKATDVAGNETIFVSQGIVIDDKAPIGLDSIKPEVTITLPEPNKNGYYGIEYGDNIRTEVNVVDPAYNGTDKNENGYYSGICKISYEIWTDGRQTSDKEQKKLFDINDFENYKDYSELVHSQRVFVDIPTAVNNSNNVILKIIAIDNAGNERITETQIGDIKIDITQPEILISYDKNNPLNNQYYNSDRTATITIKERNFNPKDVKVSIQNPYGKIPVISSWKCTKTGSGNQDDTEHQATITWHEDGDYTFGISYSDLAENQDTGMDFAGGTKNNTFFVIDQTNPEIVVSYDNNNVLNEKYYKDNRTATITVTERNFKADEVVILIENPYGNVPVISNWVTNGLNHTATITYTEDGDYTFGIAYTDLSGNRNNKETYSSISKNTNDFILDKTAPEIRVSYNNNAPSEGQYYNADRIASVVIIERNFKGDEVITEIQNTDGVIPQVSDWGVNGLNHTSTITYTADGDYIFDMKYTDLAGNTAGEVQYAQNTTNPSEFTIDKTAPVITVSYDNNQAANGKYFNAARTATISIVEHNFNPQNIVYVQTASKDGQAMAIPSVSGWTDSGDVHTASISYNADGDYTFDISMTDMSANPNEGVNYTAAAAQDFTVDMSIEKPQITGVESGKAYKQDVIPVITFSDININADYEVRLTRTKKDIIDEDVTDQFIGNLIQQDGYLVRAELDTFEKVQENDGIYTLYVTYQDLAGNIEENSVVFSVNRFGSVYTLNEGLKNLQNTYYVQKVEGELIITEYNADKLLENSLQIEITRDGQPLEQEIRYTVTPEINEFVTVGESGWYQYSYTLSNENFTKDGVYKIIVSSEDEAGNKPETTLYEDCQITFTVDTVAPEIMNITGLEKAVVNSNDIQVNYELFDSIGLKNVIVYVKGEEVLNQSEFEDLTSSVGNFVIKAANRSQHVRLVVTDLAGNTMDTDSENFKPAYEFKNDITVSTNFFIRWYAQKPLFWGSIAGAVAVAGAVVTFGVSHTYKRKTKTTPSEK